MIPFITSKLDYRQSFFHTPITVRIIEKLYKTATKVPNTLPMDEEAQLPPIGLKNPSGRCCATNPLMQTILTYPSLRNLTQTGNDDKAEVLKTAFQTIDTERNRKPSETNRENGTASEKFTLAFYDHITPKSPEVLDV